MIEGIDFSRGGYPSAETLKANGLRFVGRYAVDDKTPSGRGITAGEYTYYKERGIDVFLYWQSTTNWMLGGRSAGIYGAMNAQYNIDAAGMPAGTPVYFACDFDAEPGDQGAIDDCLRGAAEVIGAERVGLYAGFHPLSRVRANGSARWFCQTSAWSGGQVMPGAHLYQYGYNQWFDGINCDLVRAFAEHYGQAVPPAPVPVNIYPRDMSRELAGILFGRKVVTFDGKRHDLHFDPNGPISRAWLQLISDQLKPGESYRRAVVGPITSVTRRGADKRYWDVGFAGMPTIRYDTETRATV